MEPPRSEYFDRIDGVVSVGLLETRHVAVLGVGSVGSQVAKELANSGVGSFLFADGKQLEVANLPRHALDTEYLHRNKADGMAAYLKREVPGVRAEALPRHIDDEGVSDLELDKLLLRADLIVAATDNLEVQWRIGRRALAVDRPAIFPGFGENRASEVFVQFGLPHPCFRCYTGFRSPDGALRGFAALNSELLLVIECAVHVGLGLLDGESRLALLLTSDNSGPVRHLFSRLSSEAAISFAPAVRQRDCPSCSVRRSPLLPEVETPTPEQPTILTPRDLRPSRTVLSRAPDVLAAIPRAFIYGIVPWWFGCVAIYIITWTISVMADFSIGGGSTGGTVLIGSYVVLAIVTMAIGVTVLAASDER